MLRIKLLESIQEIGIVEDIVVEPELQPDLEASCQAAEPLCPCASVKAGAGMYQKAEDLPWACDS